MRPDLDAWCLRIARVVATRGTCARRQVGCVLVNARGQILATGYNGRASGLLHCNEGFACVGSQAVSGAQLDQCEAVHAESNALLQCADMFTIHTCYCTLSPCVWCVRLLMNTSCQYIVFLEEYAHTAAKDEWLGPVRRWRELRETLEDAAPRPPVRQWIRYIGDL